MTIPEASQKSGACGSDLDNIPPVGFSTLPCLTLLLSSLLLPDIGSQRNHLTLRLRPTAG